MMRARPLYESESDRRNEQSVASALERAWRCRARRLPRRYPADFVLYSSTGVARAWVEVKVRTYRAGMFPTYHLSAEKVSNLIGLEQVSGLPSLLVVRLTDALLYHRIAPPYQIEHGGRTDRADPEDTEPVCAIPFERFRPVAQRIAA